VGMIGLVANWCPRRDSNPEPTDYESAALTVELQGHTDLFNVQDKNSQV
jgi:hypothetical protein